MKKYRKSIWLPVALLVYTTAMAVYFIPRNTEISDTEKYLTVGLSYNPLRVFIGKRDSKNIKLKWQQTE